MAPVSAVLWPSCQLAMPCFTLWQSVLILWQINDDDDNDVNEISHSFTVTCHPHVYPQVK